jgi:SHS2 domain-containing protein
VAGAGKAPRHERWDLSRREDGYAELEHPTDLFLEIRGRELPELLDHALFALYDQIAELAGFEARRELTLGVREPGLDDALRALLSEVLFRFDTEGFVAVGAEVMVEQTAGGWGLQARLWGDDANRERHTLLHEIKAVTYHRLTVIASEEGWKATVLLDI